MIKPLNFLKSRIFSIGQVIWQKGGTVPDYRLTIWLFLRLLGGIYFVAFLSFATQALGLIGIDGILPVAEVFPVVSERFSGINQFLRFPTLLWLDASDNAIMFVTIIGMIGALLLIVCIAPMMTAFICWLCYLSLVTAGQNFMSFQWDILLLETGFLAISLAPWGIRPSVISQQEPPRLMIGLFRWLLFRLMFASGMVKLLSGDSTWQSLTALSYHYETQPLPNPIAWFMHQLPMWFHQLGTFATLFIEIVIPVLFFAPRRLRFFAGSLTILLQILILLTGNYTFFNLLTIALCILLFDDGLIGRRLPQSITSQLALVQPVSRYRRWLCVVIACLIGALSLIQFGRQLLRVQFPEPAIQLANHLSSLRLVNTYGLFAVMTTDRPQIIIEGSMDGEEWLEYDLHFQPQALTDMPPIVAPHQPRLDWQLWFAALGDYRNNQWFVSLVRKLLEGSPDVLALFETNPFPNEPPRYIRARRYDYVFSDWHILTNNGQWWQREFRDTYLPMISLEQFGS